jgi:pimeloyl-ACP methyl ester carboxylesterase
LLDRAGLPAPYILVGHSFSGLLVRLFAYTYPGEVAGMILVDSAHEDQYERFPAPIQAAFKPLKQMQLDHLAQLKATVAAQGPEAAPTVVSMPPALSPDLAARYKAVSVADPTRVDTMIAELENLEASQAQVRAARSPGLGEIPLVVLSHGQAQVVPGMPDEVNRDYEATWQQMQAELAALSPHGRRVVVPAAGHMIHHEHPERVVDAIREVVAEAQGSDAR